MNAAAPEDLGTSIVIEWDFTHPPSKLWRALTAPELLARWLAPNDMEPRPGARFTLRPKDSPPIACEVVEVRHERRLSFTWSLGDAAPTVVTFDLRPNGSGTAFRLAHEGFPLAPAARPIATLEPRPPLRARPTTRRASDPLRARRTEMRWAA